VLNEIHVDISIRSLYLLVSVF